MKRVLGLRDLSEDHHHGLVLARKAKSAAAGKEVSLASEVWIEVERKFNLELEPHFQIEESLIAPTMEKQGESGLVARFYEEHRALRECLSPGTGRSSKNLRHFGELLEKHIRFEEREFFESAQKCLSPDELHAIAEACRAVRKKEL